MIHRLLVCSALTLIMSNVAWAGPYTIHIGGDFRRVDRESCARKAVEAMAKAKFIRAEIDKDGNAWGHDEKSFAQVITLPYKDGVHILIFVAGSDATYTDGIRSALRTHVSDGPFDPDSPKQVASDDASRKPCDLKRRWGMEQRPTLSLLRYFQPAAAVVMEKQGLGSQQAAGMAVLGGGGHGVMATFALPGPNEVNVYVGTIAFSTDDAEADRLQSVVRTGLLKFLYD